MPEKSTNKALMQYCGKPREFIERRQCLVGSFCDVSRAFNYVDHNELLAKVYNYGVRGVAYDWLLSFLSTLFEYVVLYHQVDEHV